METRTGKRIKQIRVGRVKKLLDEGYSIKEIAEKLRIRESIIREYRKVIERAEKNRGQLQKD